MSTTKLFTLVAALMMHGLACFTAVRSGLMYEASVSGQKFIFEDIE